MKPSPVERRSREYVCSSCGARSQVVEKLLDNSWEPATNRSTWCQRCESPLDPEDTVLGVAKHVG